MKFYKRAFNSILRQKNKSIILLLVSFVLGSGIIISFLIKSAINEATDVMLARSNSAVTLSLGANINEDQITKIGKSSYVNYYDYNITSNVTSNTLKHYEGEVSKYLSGTEKTSDYFDTNFSLTGVNDPELLMVKQKQATLVKGRVFNKEEITGNSNSIIISEKFAQENALNLNSKLEVKAALQSEDNQIRERTYELNVIGILKIEDKKIVSQNNDDNASLNIELIKANQQNILLVPNSTTKAINDFLVEGEGGNNSGNVLNSTPVFILKSPYDLEYFITEEKTNLPNNSYFVSDYDNIQKSISSITILNNIASVSFVTMTLLAITVLSLIVVLFLINRRQEFGIYKALGEKKAKTIMQVAIEMSLIGLIGFIMAISISSVAASTISESIMKNTQVQVSNSDNISASDIVPYLDESSINNNYIANNYQIRISLKNVVYVIIIGTMTMLVASVGPSIYILRLKPKNILM
ncbi:ABC transporter permease [Erysipelotrichaceae bacterium OttesenSCG-928-M19]|nr:ABC transporter permease [Erysipelotrichaceae bacterium OttesenSCG-928-M19]